MRFSHMVGRLAARKTGLPGIGVLYGPAGSGKSFAAMFAAGEHGACHIQVRPFWTKRILLNCILEELERAGRAHMPAGKSGGQICAIATHLILSRRILILDGIDLAPRKGLLEAAGEIYAASQGSIALVGSENLPSALGRMENMSDCVFDQVWAGPCDTADCDALARIYCEGVAVDRERLAEIREKSRGCARSIALCLDRMKEMRAIPGGNMLEHAPLSEYVGGLGHSLACVAR